MARGFHRGYTTIGYYDIRCSTCRSADRTSRSSLSRFALSSKQNLSPASISTTSGKRSIFKDARDVHLLLAYSAKRRNVTPQMPRVLGAVLERPQPTIDCMMSPQIQAA